MNIRNVEYKARVHDCNEYEHKLLAHSPVFKGTDVQTDTYFKVPRGRLKLREGNIENALIQYQRENLSGAKQSSVVLYKHQPDPALKEILIHQFGVLQVVVKTRKIYFIGHVKFHFDKVAGLGDFIETEVIDEQGQYTVEELKNECDRWISFFELTPHQMVRESYSDLLLGNRNPTH